MLTKSQIKELKEHLERAQNPAFFFDNDQDGLCSFLLLQRFLGRGKGIAVKSYPGMDKGYFRRVQELGADYIFILDKPVVDSAFFEEAHNFNVPVVYIDHHAVQSEQMTVPDYVNYYNPIYNKKSTNEPVTALCYQVTQRKEDLWLAVAGCIFDVYIPEYYDEFKKEYPDLVNGKKDAMGIFYGSSIGEIVRMMGAGLKDTTTNVVRMMKFLMSVKTPYDVLEENNDNKQMHKRYNYVKSRQEKFYEKALKESSGKVLAFKYGGDLSISGELSNELMYKFPKKIILVGYVNGGRTNISARGDKVREIVLKAIEGLDATAGGHEVAVGAQIRSDDWDDFVKRVKELSK